MLAACRQALRPFFLRANSRIAQTRTVFVHFLSQQIQVSVCYRGKLSQQKHASGSTRSPLEGSDLTLGPQITNGTGRMDTEGHTRMRSSTCFFRGFMLSRAQFCVPCSRSKLWHRRPEFIPEAIKHLISHQNTWYLPLDAGLIPGHTNPWNQRVRGMWLFEAKNEGFLPVERLLAVSR